MAIEIKVPQFPESVEDNVCPDFGLKAVKNPSGEITQILCDVPPAELDLPPFQFLNISVPARSAPHRMFFSDGEHYDELTMQLSPEQEDLFGQTIEEIKLDKLDSINFNTSIPSGKSSKLGN